MSVREPCSKLLFASANLIAVFNCTAILAQEATTASAPSTHDASISALDQLLIAPDTVPPVLSDAQKQNQTATTAESSSTPEAQSVPAVAAATELEPIPVPQNRERAAVPVEVA